MIWGTLQQGGLHVNLLDATKGLLRLSVVDTWGADEHRVFRTCIYPNYKILPEQGRDLVDLGDLLEQWSTMDLGAKDGA
jgi:hypothetical protein